MRFGFSLPNNQGVARVGELVEIAVAAEANGYASVWVSEHLFHASYVAARLGDAPYHDPLTTLAAVAAATDAVRLGTSVIVLPWHHPVRLAKTFASLDELSGGRMILGVGVANAEDEYLNLGVPFRERGRIANEMLEAIASLWSEELPQFDGRYFSFAGLRFEPKPVQQPRLPVFVGGSSEAALRRVVRFGDGWHPLSPSVLDVRAGIERMRALCDDTGRDSASIRIVPRLMTRIMEERWERPLEERRTLRGTIEEIDAMVRAYAAVGVEEIVIDANSRDLERTRELLVRVARDVTL